MNTQAVRQTPAPLTDRWESEGGAVRHEKPDPSADRIRQRAYEIYRSRQRTGNPGTPAADWAQAERDVNLACARKSPAARETDPQAPRRP